MAVGSLLKTTTRVNLPFDGSLETNAQTARGGSDTTEVSDFLTIQSLTNFTVMTTAITAAWRALERVAPTTFDSLWVPFGFAVAWGVLSVGISLDGLKKPTGGLDRGKFFTALFIALLNSLMLASAILGIETAIQGDGSTRAP